MARLERLLTALAVAIPNPHWPLLLSPKRRERALKLPQWKAAVMGAAAVLTMATGVTPAGVAAAPLPSCPVPPGSTGVTDVGCANVMQLDGNLPWDTLTTPTHDWTKGSGTAANGVMNDDGSPNASSGAIANTGVIHDYVQPDHTYFAQNKDTENTTAWGCITQNNVLNKDDLLNAYAVVMQVPANAPNRAGHRMLYVASERQANNGDAFAGFWLLANGVSCATPMGSGHSTHDVLLRADYTNGGGLSTLSIDRWNGSGLTNVETSSDCATVDASKNSCGRVNAGPITPTWCDSTSTPCQQPLLAGDFVEIGVDLTALGVDTGPQGQTLCSSTFLAETRSSQESTATLKDFAFGALDICRATTTTTSVDGNGTTTANAGASVYDTATIGNASPTASGTITYNLYSGSGANACTGTPVFTDTETVTNGVAPNSKPWTAVPGAYEWQASYSGDLATGGIDEPSTSACGSEPLTVMASPSIATTPSATKVNAGVSFSDTATITNGANPATGASVTFKLYGPFTQTTGAPSTSNCTSSNLVHSFTQSTAATSSSTGATYNSDTYSTTATGTYQWVASYSGNSTNHPAAGACGDTTEQVTVDSITTAPSADVHVGQTVHDTATLKGGSNPGDGTVVFNLYGPFTSQPTANSCTQQPIYSSPAQSSSTSDYSTATYTSPNFTVTLAGWYQWIAVYSGSANDANVSGACGDPTEQVTGDKIVTSATASVSLSQSISDTATVTGANPTGTVTFALYGPNDANCSGTNLLAGNSAYTVTLSSGQAIAPPYTPSAAGTYRWVATYNGDQNNAVVSGNCNDANETSTVLAPSLSLTKTAADAKSVPAGHTIGFKIVVANAGPGAAFNVNISDTLPTVTGFTWTISNTPSQGTCNITSGTLNCNLGTLASGASVEIDVVSNTGANSAGTYPNTVTVSSTNASAPPASATEYVIAISTSATPSVSLSQNISDTATVSGGNSPTGSVTFNLYGPSDPNCTSAAVFTDTEPLVSGSATSKPFATTATGVYHWIATYNGDSNNSAVSGHCGDPNESSTVLGPNLSVLKTAADAKSVPEGHSIGFTILVSNTGTGDALNVTLTDSLPPVSGFTWSVSSGPTQGSCSPIVNNVLNCSFGTITAGGSVSLSVTSGTGAGSAGTYPNTVTVTSSNGGTHQSNATEYVIGISTQASASVSVGQGISDTATVHGGNNPTGTVTFNLYGPNDPNCASAPVFTSTNSLTGTSATSGTYIAAAAGTYEWIATYNGDSNNSSVSGACGDLHEMVVVLQPNITISKTADDATESTTEQIGFTVTVTSQGPGTALGVTVNDPLPGGTGIDWSINPAYSGPGNCSITGTAPNQTLSCTLGDMAPGATATVHIVSNTTSGSAGTYNNTATACATNIANCSSSQATVTVLAPNLSILKTADDATENTGEQIGFTITVSNSNAEGTGTAFNVTLSDPLPGGTGIDWSINPAYSGPGNCSISGTPPTQTLNCQFGDMAPGATASVHIVSATTSGSAGTYNNTAQACADNNACVTSTAGITVQAPNLALSKTADHTQAVPTGTTIGFVVTLTNNGDGAATGVLLTDTLPNVPSTGGSTWVIASVTKTGSDLSAVNCVISSGSPQVLTCGAGTPPAAFQMGAGDSISVHVTHATDGGSPGVYPNTAQVVSTNNSVSPLSSSATEAVLSLTTSPSGTVAAGQSISDTATIHGGNAPVTGTVTFNLYNSTVTCDSSTLVTTFSDVPLNNGTATSPSYTTGSAALTYQWVATYNGDAHNMAVSGKCGDASEQVTTTAVVVLPARTGDWSIFMVLGAPLLLIGAVLLFLGRRRREDEAEA